YAAPADRTHRVVRVDAERSAAVRDDLDVVVHVPEPALHLVGRYRTGALDVSGLELGGRADVEHDDDPFAEPPRELFAGDRLDRAVGAEVGACEPIDAGYVFRGDVAQRGPGLADSPAREGVVDAGSVAPGRDESGLSQCAEVVGGVGDA